LPPNLKVKELLTANDDSEPEHFEEKSPAIHTQSQSSLRGVFLEKEVMSSEAVAVTRDIIPPHEKIPGFDLVGRDGYCVDVVGNMYSFVGSVGVYSTKECAERCTQCPGKGQADNRKLVGFQYDSKYSVCSCLVESGGTFSDGLCGDQTRVSTDYLGTGEISGTLVTRDTVDHEECWKVISPEQAG
jgi:hypothetical protein